MKTFNSTVLPYPINLGKAISVLIGEGKLDLRVKNSVVRVKVVNTEAEATQLAKNVASYNIATTGKKQGKLLIFKGAATKKVLTVQELSVDPANPIPETAMGIVTNLAQLVIDSWKLLNYIEESKNL